MGRSGERFCFDNIVEVGGVVEAFWPGGAVFCEHLYAGCEFFIQRGDEGIGCFGHFGKGGDFYLICVECESFYEGCFGFVFSELVAGFEFREHDRFLRTVERVKGEGQANTAEVYANLVCSACDGFYGEEACCLEIGEAAVFSVGGFSLAWVYLHAAGVFPAGGEGGFDRALFATNETVDKCEVGFLHPAVYKFFCQASLSFFVQGDEHYAGGVLVEAVENSDVGGVFKLVTQQGDDIRCAGSVLCNRDAGGLVDRDKIFISV